MVGIPGATVRGGPGQRWGGCVTVSFHMAQADQASPFFQLELGDKIHFSFELARLMVGDCLFILWKSQYRKGAVNGIYTYSASCFSNENRLTVKLLLFELFML